MRGGKGVFAFGASGNAVPYPVLNNPTGGFAVVSTNQRGDETFNWGSRRVGGSRRRRSGGGGLVGPFGYNSGGSRRRRRRGGQPLGPGPGGECWYNPFNPASPLCP